MAKRASSSMQTTAGSTFLSWSSGAISRTTAPTLMIKTWQSYRLNLSASRGPIGKRSGRTPAGAAGQSFSET
jgi:hypothetical protein